MESYSFRMRFYTKIYRVVAIPRSSSIEIINSSALCPWSDIDRKGFFIPFLTPCTKDGIYREGREDICVNFTFTFRKLQRGRGSFDSRSYTTVGLVFRTLSSKRIPGKVDFSGPTGLSVAIRIVLSYVRSCVARAGRRLYFRFIRGIIGRYTIPTTCFVFLRFLSFSAENLPPFPLGKLTVFIRTGVPRTLSLTSGQARDNI